MSNRSPIWFHSPCFDGIVSAVLVWDFLENARGWVVGDLCPVSYAMRPSWLNQQLPERSAVVDFLYHPGAAFWADHHATTFLSPELREHYDKRNDPCIIYDPLADSCAGLLWTHFTTVFKYQNDRYRDLVRWAKKTDSASYASVREALSSREPALRINASLVYGDSDSYSAFLVRKLRETPLEFVASLPEVASRYERYQRDLAEALEIFRSAARLEGDIVVFDIDAKNAFVPRYAPYEFFPKARYSVGIVRRPGTATITAMRNPWREFSSVHLGNEFEQLGGGGHSRVGSVVLRGADIAKARGLLETLISKLLNRSQDVYDTTAATSA
jgi:hypothetical protein